MSRRFVCCLLLSLVVARLMEAEEATRADQFGDPLPAQPLARLGTIRFLHGGCIGCLAYSPDGKLLASGGVDKKIVLWDAQTGCKIRTLTGHRGWLRMLAFSPDSKFLVSEGLDSRLQGTHLLLWNVATGKLLFPLKVQEENTESLAFSPDGKTIASGHDHDRIRLWEVGTGKTIRILECGTEEGNVTSVAFAPDGKMLTAVASGCKIHCWDLQTGKKIDRKEKLAEGLSVAALSRDGTVLAAAGGTDGDVRLYQTSNLKELKRLERHDGKVTSLALSPDARTLIGICEDENLRLWDVTTGKLLRHIAKKADWVHGVSLSPNGKTVASASMDSRIDCWDRQTGIARQLPEGHTSRVAQVNFLPDGETVVSRGPDAQVIRWPYGTGKQANLVKLPLGSTHCLFCPDRSTLAVTTTEGSLLLLEIATGKEIARCPVAKTREILAVSANKKRLVVRDADFQVQVLDVPTTKVIHQFRHDRATLGLSPDGRMLLIGMGRLVSAWDLDSNQEIPRWKPFGLEAPHFVFSPDGRMVGVHDSDSTIYLVETSTCKERRQFQGHSGSVNAVAFSPDGRMLASGGDDKTVRVWDIRGGKERQVFRGHFDSVHAVGFSPNGCRLVSGSADTTALIWNIPAVRREQQPPAVRLGQEEQNTLWAKLAEADAAMAYAALQRLVAAPTEAVALCKARLFQTQTPPEKIQRWIVQLDDEEYTVREEASRNLELAESDAENLLEKALKGKCSPEAGRRMEALLETVRGKELNVRVLRAVELLEQIGTPDAVAVLRQLGCPTSDARIRDDVEASLRRLSAKP